MQLKMSAAKMVAISSRGRWGNKWASTNKIKSCLEEVTILRLEGNNGAINYD